MAAEQGIYLDFFEVLGSGYLNPNPNPTIPSAWARRSPIARIPTTRSARLEEGESSTTSAGWSPHLALRTDRGYINKVRFNHPESAGEAGFAGFVGFTVEWTQAVQRA